MGILETVRDEHAGIIPRSISQRFDHVLHHQVDTEIVITMSFLQLYRETIQDLLAPSSTEDNLIIREGIIMKTIIGLSAISSLLFHNYYYITPPLEINILYLCMTVDTYFLSLTILL